MSNVQPPPYSSYPTTRVHTSSSGGDGLAVAALVLALVGLLFFPLALVGMILGIVALVRGTPAKGMAIASVCIAPLTVVTCFLAMGIMLPALGQARQEAQRVKSSAQIRALSQGLIMYANDYNDWYPERGADWRQRLLNHGIVTPDLFDAPGAEPGMESYFYIPGYRQRFESDVVILYENPDLWRGRGGHVVYDDNHVEWIAGEEYGRLFQELERLRRGD